MNIALESSQPAHHPAQVWQTDTGPVCVPDLSRRYSRPSDAISLGFVAINNLQPDNADFVTEVRTAAEQLIHVYASLTLEVLA